MAASDIPNTSAATLEPHQLSTYLELPTQQQQMAYVVEHCNYILPQLASDSLATPVSPKVVPTFTTLPSSLSLETYLAELTSAHQHAASRTAELEAQLRRQLLSSLSGAKILKQRLSSLPDDIASTEDKLLDLCEDLVIADGPLIESAPQSSKDAVNTLMIRLDQLHTAIGQLKKAKDYFSILAQAEDLRFAVEKSDKDETNRADSLQKLCELDQLVRKVEKLSAFASEPQQRDDTNEPKLVAFLRAQRSTTFKTLRKARSSRLSEAIAATGWSQGKADAAHTYLPASQVSSSDSVLTSSSAVTAAWSELNQLQDVAEQLFLLPRATAKPDYTDTQSETEFDAGPIPAGSDAYQPLLTTSCLIEPLLLRFRYHFDGDRSTNRLDKPEWFLSHILALIRTHDALFTPATHKQPGSGGAVVRLNRAYANLSPKTRREYRHIDTRAELLHGLLTPLRRKLASTMPTLLDHPSLLAHTVFQALTFDADLAEQFPKSLTVLGGAGTRKISDDILDNAGWFNKWLEGEKEFALQRFEDIINSPNAWAIGSSDSLADDDEQTFHPSLTSSSTASSREPGQRTTRSARSTVEILESVSERYRPLPSLSQRLSFLAIIQLPILRSYAQRLTRSLDAFESLSSAFARAMPGEIVPGSGPASLVSGGADSDMVKGLRGLGRLVKALLSAQYVCSELERWSETAAFVEMSESLHSTEEGRALALGLRKDEHAEEDRQLDAASLGMLLRRGLKRGAAVARPLASSSGGGVGGGQSPVQPAHSGESGMGTPKLNDIGSKQVLTEFGRYGVWEEPRRKFGEIATRAITAIERLVTSEVVEQLRPYILQRWDQESDSSSNKSEKGLDEEGEGEGEGEEKEAYPTPTLIPALSILSTHLSHLASILDRETFLPIYRHISSSIASTLVDRVVMSGGSRRFNWMGGVRFSEDLKQGWLGVVGELVNANHDGGSSSRGAALFGRRPEASWKVARDAARLLTLPSSTSGGHGEKASVTLAKAVQVVFDSGERREKGSEYIELMGKLGVDDTKVNVKEVLRRRVEVWK
ncbi:uncharacterized protein MEPE_05931 [Melanopsichium pennsylvanicum]|uniref:RINT-1 family protein n=2 Tax=Melanopsichium pennsylvanicum TaxID=63383 RepID=A0AAJ4XSN7_9BASI|nr:conserved hypothetical protein [Melanopsichium pennsylvanicum 4]SNX87221.1 uncharacterized protein MEPE_05931 [Melanopsichium pennsylvanicum]